MGRQAEGPWPNAEQLSICDYAQDVPLASHNVRLHEDFEFEERVFGDGDAILIWLQTWQPACRLTANDPGCVKSLHRKLTARSDMNFANVRVACRLRFRVETHF
jgi:hypothetical protein